MFIDSAARGIMVYCGNLAARGIILRHVKMVKIDPRGGAHVYI
jgi:hypothetical protein